MLERREECDTYLTHVCRHHCSGKNPVFSLGSLCFSDVYRCESGRCHTLPFFLTLFYHFTFPSFPFILILQHNEPRGKESTEVRISQNKGKESENSYQKLKRSLKDRPMKTHRNCIEIFQRAQPSFTIRREQIFVNTRQRWHH